MKDGNKSKMEVIKMFKSLIFRIEETVSLNFQNADKVDVQRSSFTAGMIRGYLDVLMSMGHNVQSGSWDDNGCDRIGYMEIDGLVLVKNSKLNMDVYAELLKK
jgi:hypothetical protein